MRPSHPVRYFCAVLNQRVFCRFLRCSLLVEWLGTDTRLTPSFSAVLVSRREELPHRRPRRAVGTPVLALMLLVGGHQQVRIARALVEDFVAGDDLILSFLDLGYFAELGRLGGFALADDFGVRLEDVLSSFPSACVLPWNTRTRACCMTC